MRKFILFTLCLGLVFSVAGARLRKELKVDYTDKNATAKWLAGHWIPDSAINKRLGRETGQWKLVEFVRNDRVVLLIPDRFVLPLHRFRIFSAGWMRTEKQSCPFVLLHYQGNPALMYFLPKKDGGYGDGRSVFLFLAQGKARNQDILCISSGPENSIINAYRRR